MVIKFKVEKYEHNILGLLAEDNIYEDMMYDNEIPLEEYALDFNENTYYFCYINKELAGMYILQKFKPNANIIHIGFKKKFRGFQVYASTMQFLSTLKDSKVIGMLYAFVPVNRKHVISHGIKVGFTTECLIPKASKVNGIWEDEIILTYRIN